MTVKRRKKSTTEKRPRDRHKNQICRRDSLLDEWVEGSPSISKSALLTFDPLKKTHKHVEKVISFLVNYSVSLCTVIESLRHYQRMTGIGIRTDDSVVGSCN